MPWLKLSRRVPGAVEIKVINQNGAQTNYFVGKRLAPSRTDPNQTPWRISQILPPGHPETVK